jgi:N-acetylmuramoyl-L-alanine amidase
VDPNINFPWQLLSTKGFGAWFNPDATIQLPTGISIPLALNLVGYDIKDTTAAKLAFKRHFRQDSTAILNEQDLSVLAQLILNKVKK